MGRVTDANAFHQPIEAHLDHTENFQKVFRRLRQTGRNDDQRDASDSMKKVMEYLEKKKLPSSEVSVATAKWPWCCEWRWSGWRSLGSRRCRMSRFVWVCVFISVMAHFQFDPLAGRVLLRPTVTGLDDNLLALEVVNKEQIKKNLQRPFWYLVVQSPSASF